MTKGNNSLSTSLDDCSFDACVWMIFSCYWLKHRTLVTKQEYWWIIWMNKSLYKIRKKLRSWFLNKNDKIFEITCIFCRILQNFMFSICSFVFHYTNIQIQLFCIIKFLILQLYNSLNKVTSRLQDSICTAFSKRIFDQSCYFIVSEGYVSPK